MSSASAVVRAKNLEASLYIVILPKARTTGDYPERGYAGPSGRLDVAARAYQAILDGGGLLSLLLGGPGLPVALYSPPDCKEARSERGFMIEAKRALKGYRSCFTATRLESPIDVFKAMKNRPLVYLIEGGEDVSRVPEILFENPAIVLGGHVDPPEWLDLWLRKHSSRLVSVGPRSLQADHVVFFVSWLRAHARAVATQSWF